MKDNGHELSNVRKDPGFNFNLKFNRNRDVHRHITAEGKIAAANSRSLHRRGFPHINLQLFTRD